jgi:hypothetical protein
LRIAGRRGIVRAENMKDFHLRCASSGKKERDFHGRSGRERRLSVLVAVAAVALGLAAIQACGSGAPSEFDPGAGDPASGGPFDPFGSSSGGADEGGMLDADPGQLVIQPQLALVPIVISNGVVTTNPPRTFTAHYGGQQVAASWLFDRGEIGDVDANGVFKASGKNVGEGTITARYGAREATAKVKVMMAVLQNGAVPGSDAGPGGFGGLGGVGGEPLGGPVPAGVVAKLKTQSSAPATPAELGFLYPYDGTVWPRGLLPPLLMWQTTHEASAVWVKLSQNNFTFEGTYSVDSHAAGSAARKRVRLDDAVWRIATQGNLGTDLEVEVKIWQASNDTVYGPIKEKWKVAPGVLKGTVYYNSYDSMITAGSGYETGGVIAIKPRSPEPALALATEAGKCHVCHTLSADGSTLFVQDANYADGASYRLNQTPIARTPYPGNTVTAHNRKFAWSAPYPDGSFALASSRFTREAYTQSDAKLFDRASGAEVTATGLGGVVQSAVTPTFSPDGKKVAFNFWEGAGAGGVNAGAGRSLAVFDFTCGAPAGSTTCASTPTFSGLRQIYSDAARWPAWPSFLPDGKAVVFHNAVNGGACGPGQNVVDRNSIYNCMLTTWFGATSEIWIAQDGAAQNARRLDALNGRGAAGTSYLPTSASHADDTIVNYMPTVNPVASGGYYWVVFTSRRLYGNVLTTHPWDKEFPDGGVQVGSGSPSKKLWVAAIDIHAPGGIDPSHPAFYLPGQELGAGNARGFWVVDPCKPNGTSCETGDECCNGFCRKDPDGGALVCSDKPPGTTCVLEFEKCTIDADCCDPKFRCIAGKCTRPAPIN